MPKNVLFHRFVVDTVVGPQGTLVPATGAAWKWERATDETDLVDRLASMTDAPDGAVAQLATRFGPLRLRAPALAVRDSFVRENVARDSVSMLSELASARHWYVSGMASREPAHARVYVAAGYAWSVLDPGTRAAAARLVNDDAALANVDIDLASSLRQLASGFLTAYLVRPRTGCEPIVRGLDTLDRLLRGLAGMEAIPALERAGGSGRVLSELVTSLPDFVTWIGEAGPNAADVAQQAFRELAIEAPSEWRAAATYVKATRDTIDLIAAVNGRLLTADETALLRSTGAVVTGWAPDSDLRAAEIGDRLAPLVRTSLEHQLDEAGIWPVRHGVTAGAYWRALAMLWQRLTDERLPRLCATDGCDQTIGPHGNRQYCDIHRAERQRVRVQLRRRAEKQAP